MDRVFIVVMTKGVPSIKIKAEKVEIEDGSCILTGDNGSGMRAIVAVFPTDSVDAVIDENALLQDGE